MDQFKFRGHRYRAVNRRAAADTLVDQVLFYLSGERGRFTDLMEELEDEAYDEDVQVQDLLVARIQTRLRADFGEGMRCYRALDLPATVDPTTLKNIGVYWSYDRRAARPYDAWEGEGPTVVYSASISAASVDKARMVANNMLFDEDEQEVTFHKDSPIWVYSVELQDGTVVEINDWRTT